MEKESQLTKEELKIINLAIQKFKGKEYFWGLFKEKGIIEQIADENQKFAGTVEEFSKQSIVASASISEASHELKRIKDEFVETIDKFKSSKEFLETINNIQNLALKDFNSKIKGSLEDPSLYETFQENIHSIITHELKNIRN